MLKIKVNKRILLISLLAIFGFFIFIFDLGSTGLVDETPPLFAAAGRAMSESGDWLTPKVNGILRFDKPPLFYWFMAIFYSLPASQYWDINGSLSARLPSAISSLVLMVIIADTFLLSQRDSKNKILLALVSSLAFALSPLVIIWSKTAVSDALLCGMLGLSLLFFWRRMEIHKNKGYLYPWFFLGLAILTKGPVAFIIVFLTLSSYIFLQKDRKKILVSLKPIKGILLTLIICLPWYLILLIKEGESFFESFFGYHNLQRYTSVVNNHSEPWWFFIFIMILGSLPFSIFLIHGIFETTKEMLNDLQTDPNKSSNLYVFALCWLISVFVFFSISATKLPSYWLPAVPAASILIAKSASIILEKNKKINYTLLFTSLIFFGLTIAFFLSHKWLVLINDPEMPNLVKDINNIGLLNRARSIFLILTIFCFFFLITNTKKAIFYLQILFLSVPLFLMPQIRKIADNSRQLPLRDISSKIFFVRKDKEPLAMIGIRKPSLHFYSKQIVFYEQNTEVGMINLSERFHFDKRSNYFDTPNYDSNSFLVVIDKYSIEKKHWKNFKYENLGSFGVYYLLRVNRYDFDLYVSSLLQNGVQSSWRIKNFEKF